MKIGVFDIKLLPTLVTLVAISILCKLGFWQLERANEKASLLDSMSSVVTLSSLQSLPDFEPDKSYRLVANGTINSDQIWLVDNQTWQGKVGYQVVSKFANNGSEVLVCWGWIAAPVYRDQLPVLELPKRVELAGLIRHGYRNAFTLDKASIGKLDNGVQRVQSIDAIFSQLNIDPYIVYADSLTLPGIEQNYQPINMSPERHNAYAVQWFSLAVAALVVFMAASFIKRGKHES